MLGMYGKHFSGLRLADYKVLVKDDSLVCILQTNLFFTAAVALHWGGCVQLPTPVGLVRSLGPLS